MHHIHMLMLIGENLTSTQLSVARRREFMWLTMIHEPSCNSFRDLKFLLSSTTTTTPCSPVLGKQTDPQVNALRPSQVFQRWKGHLDGVRSQTLKMAPKSLRRYLYRYR